MDNYILKNNLKLCQDNCANYFDKMDQFIVMFGNLAEIKNNIATYGKDKSVFALLDNQNQLTESLGVSNPEDTNEYIYGIENKLSKILEVFKNIFLGIIEGLKEAVEEVFYSLTFRSKKLAKLRSISLTTEEQKLLKSEKLFKGVITDPTYAEVINMYKVFYSICHKHSKNNDIYDSVTKFASDIEKELKPFSKYVKYKNNKITISFDSNAQYVTIYDTWYGQKYKKYFSEMTGAFLERTEFESIIEHENTVKKVLKNLDSFYIDMEKKFKEDTPEKQKEKMTWVRMYCDNLYTSIMATLNIHSVEFDEIFEISFKLPSILKKFRKKHDLI